MLEDAFVAEVKIDSCTKCPYCVSKIGFLHDDADNSKLNCNVYICTKGAYGKKDDIVGRYYTEGYDSKPNEIHPKCPFVEFDILDKYNLEISYKK